MNSLKNLNKKKALIGITSLLFLTSIALGAICAIQQSQLKSLKNKIENHKSERNALLQELSLEINNSQPLADMVQSSESDNIDNPCPPTYTASEGDVSHTVNRKKIILQLFPNENNLNLWASCVYTQRDGVWQNIYGNKSHKGLTLLATVQNKYLLLGQGCGTECYHAFLLNIDQQSTVYIPTSPYFKISNDSKWLVTCDRTVVYDKEKPERINPKMCRSISLTSLQTYQFATNPYYSDFKITDEKLFDQYQLNIDDPIAFERNRVLIRFIDGEDNIAERSFSISEDFKEI